MKKLLSAAITLLIVLLVYFSWPEQSIEQPRGILAPDEPQQNNLDGNQGIIMNGYLVNKLAGFKLDARVLGKENYYIDEGSEISPVDLALGWGLMSDQSVVDKISITQGKRWYMWRANPLPIPKNIISKSSANMHIIPADDDVEEIIDETIVGNIIHLEGFLVKVIGPDGFKWRSSLSRTDQGDGACELFYVEKILIIQ